MVEQPGQSGADPLRLPQQIVADERRVGLDDQQPDATPHRCHRLRCHRRRLIPLGRFRSRSDTLRRRPPGLWQRRRAPVTADSRAPGSRHADHPGRSRDPSNRRRPRCGSSTRVASASSPMPRVGPRARSWPRALHGLACVKHRGAAAADGLTSDGCGVLTPIPAALFGEGNGVVTLFVRGADAKTLVEDACAAEQRRGHRLAQARDRRQRARPHGRPRPVPRSSRPVIAPPVDSPYSDEVTAYRIRRHLAGVDGLYVVSCSFRTIVYKGLAAADHLADFYLDLADPALRGRLHDLPPAVLDQHPAHLGAGPALPHALPQRRDQHHPGQRNRMLARSVLGTEEAGLGPEDLFRPVLDDNTSDSGQARRGPRAAGPGRARRRATPWPCSCPRRGSTPCDLDPEVRGFYRYHSALMEPWDGPAGLIFTDGVGVGAALDRNGLRPLRYAICEDGLVVCSSEVGAVDVSGHGKVERGRLGPGQMLFVDPTPGRAAQRRREGAPGRRATPTPHWAADGFLSFGPGEPGRAGARGPRGPPGRPRLHAGGAAMVLSPWPPRATSPPSRWATTRPCPRWPAGPAPCTTT